MHSDIQDIQEKQEAVVIELQENLLQILSEDPVDYSILRDASNALATQVDKLATLRSDL